MHLLNLPPEASGLVTPIGRAFFLARRAASVLLGRISKGGWMHKIKSDFKSVSPALHRRWGGKFYNPRHKTRRPKSIRPAFGYTKPHGQEQ